MTHTVTLIPGDGIGPEVVEAALRVLSAAGAPLAWEREAAGMVGITSNGHPLAPRVLESIAKNRVALKGPTETPVGGGHRSVNVQLRQSLQLFANVRPVRSILGTKRKYDQVDLIVIRENTEDLFCGIENEIVPGVVTATKLITEKASTRVARFAFECARAKGRKRVTAGHKANIMKLADGLFLACCRKVAKEYPEIRYDEILVDNLCTQLVLDPCRFDVLVLENLYGDMVSDLCAGLIGGLGLASGGNHGHEIAVFEAVHGSAPDIAGHGVANPTAMILTSVLMLEHLGEVAIAQRIHRATAAVVLEGKTVTRDLGGTARTGDFVDAVISRLE